ncbi:hypothetical protein Tco_0994526 [Tanacetum coccineum]
MFWIRAKEVSGWIPDFVEDDEQESDTDDEIRDEELHDESVGMHNHATVKGQNDVEEVSETIFKNKQYQAHKKDDLNVGHKDIRSEDPFNIYDLLNLKQDNIIRGDGCLQNIHVEKVASEVKKTRPLSNSKDDREEFICLGQFKKAEVPRSGGSMLQLMVDLMKIGQTMGYNMEKLVIMVDFNEVRKQAERYGSIFNVQGVDAFNSFISAVGLEEVPLGGCLFTWFHKLATKMSKLDRFLICEDKGDGNYDVLNKRMPVFQIVTRIQKTRIDEVDGIWIDSPCLVKSEFLSHFTNRFDQPQVSRLQLDMDFPNKRNIDQQTTAKIGCATLEAPLSYLGLKVGGLIYHVQSWNEIVNNIVARLSNWKMNTLSIGDRLMLLKLVVGSMPIYHMSLFKVPIKVLQRKKSIRCHFFNSVDHNGKKLIWVKWSKVLASKEKGGLGVLSFYALNRALLFKWVWRFRTQGSSLWARVIKGIHSEDDLIGFIHKKMGNGADTSFWEDVWKGDGAFKSLYPRIYALETCKNVTLAIKMSINNVGYPLKTSTNRVALDEYMGVWFRSEVSKAVDQEDDVLLLRLLDTFVHGMYEIVHKREKDVRELNY